MNKNNQPEIDEDENDGSGAYALQELSECIKWLAEVQIYQGTKSDVDINNGGNACGSWYVAKINQTIAEKMIRITDKMLKEI